MQTQTSQGPWWAALTVWAVVNAVNVLQSAGFLSRIPTGSMAINSLLGYVMIGLAVPAALAGCFRPRSSRLAAVDRSCSLHRLGPALMIVVDYVSPVEFRSPPRYGILVPYLMLFFGSILLMGIPMFRLNRGLWMVTVTSTVLLLSSMLSRDAKGSRLTTAGHSACHRVAARLVTQQARPADGQKVESLKTGAFAAVGTRNTLGRSAWLAVRLRGRRTSPSATNFV